MTRTQQITKTCIDCGKDTVMMVDPSDLARLDSEHIQNVMPYLTDGERELFISGICGSCFDALFSEEGDWDEDDKEAPAF
jgi:hypothetical protein